MQGAQKQSEGEFRKERRSATQPKNCHQKESDHCSNIPRHSRSQRWTRKINVTNGISSWIQSFIYFAKPCWFRKFTLKPKANLAPSPKNRRHGNCTMITTQHIQAPKCSYQQPIQKNKRVTTPKTLSNPLNESKQRHKILHPHCLNSRTNARAVNTL